MVFRADGLYEADGLMINMQRLYQLLGEYNAADQDRRDKIRDEVSGMVRDRKILIPEKLRSSIGSIPDFITNRIQYSGGVDVPIFVSMRKSN